MSRTIAVIGLGYVGLPIACAFGKAGLPVIGYDIDSTRIEALKANQDVTRECDEPTIRAAKIRFTDDPHDLKKANFVIITVPTPIDKANCPDLSFLRSASLAVGENLSKGSIVAFESTVYPGVTEEICVPILEQASNLKFGVDFKVGYCPERLNPGDKEHTLDKVIKVVSGSDAPTLEAIAQIYGTICKAGIWKAPNIKTAEAAKVIENVQRDLNIALMNELSMLFQKIGINTKDVIEAASTKWNFHSYKPGLVGGHCIGVDPYYLTYLAEMVGHHPELILAGRRINDHMADRVVDQVLLGLVKTGKVVTESKVLILGITFKENIPDTRNSKLYQVIQGLKKYGVDVHACDPFVSHEKILSHFLASPVHWPLNERRYDALVLAVPHHQFKEALNPKAIEGLLQSPGTVLDLKWMFKASDFSKEILYESL